MIYMVKPDHTAPYRLLITFVNSLDPLMVFLKEFFENIDFEKKQQMTKKHAKLPSRQKVNLVHATVGAQMEQSNQGPDT